MKSRYTENTSSMKALKFSLNQILLLASVALLTGLLLGYLFTQNASSDIVHIRSDQVFHSFSLKKELESTLNNVRQSREQILQNLELRIQNLKTKGTSLDSLQALQQEYLSRQEAFTIDNQKQAQEYDAQIWTQLNQYIQDYCAQNGYAYVLGSTGVGNLMGADPNKDVTESVIAFVNQRYSGKI